MSATFNKALATGLTVFALFGLAACDGNAQQNTESVSEAGFAENITFDINSKTGICFALYVPKDISLVGRDMEKVSCTDEVLGQIDPEKLQSLTVTPKI